MIVMIMAVLLVFTVLLLEFRSFLQPLAIVMGALLALLGRARFSGKALITVRKRICPIPIP